MKSSKIYLIPILFMMMLPNLGQCAVKNLIDDFGTIPLGRHIKQLPAGAKILKGCETNSKTYVDCTFTAADGLNYYIYDGVVEGIYYEFKDSKQTILGLKFGDDLRVIKQLEARYNIKFTKSMVETDTVFASETSKTKSCPFKCRIFITFDKKALIKKIEKQPTVPAF